MIATYRRNRDFKKNILVYRFALNKWAWGERKNPNKETVQRLRMVFSVYMVMFEWEMRDSFLSRFFTVPPDRLVKEVLSWD